jgi:RHS repeat-associated protein
LKSVAATEVLNVAEETVTISYREFERQRWEEHSTSYSRRYVYDELGRVKRARLGVALSGSQTYFLTDYRYDLLNRLTEITYPESTTVRYEYEGPHLKRVCDIGSYSNCDAAPGDIITNVTYDAFGRRWSTVAPSGTRTFTYDAAHRVQNDSFAGISPGAYTYNRNTASRDGLGNIRSITGSTSAGDLPIGEDYSYDHLSRIQSWTKAGLGTVTYAYDPLGNLALRDGQAQLYQEPNRPHAITSIPATNTTYSYDGDGNVQSILGTNRNQHFLYDSASRLRCIGSTPGSCTISIKYDVDGRRIYRSEPQGGTAHAQVFVGDHYVYTWPTSESRVEISAFGERVAYKTNPTSPLRQSELLPFAIPDWLFPALGSTLGAALLAWALREGLLEALARRPGYSTLAIGLTLTLLPPPALRAGGGGQQPVTRWELPDGLGTTQLIVNSDGTRSVQTLSTPYGKDFAKAPANSLQREYYGGHLEDSAGLVYMQARWYDPASGRFMSVDPLVSRIDDPRTHNGYAYANDNPIAYNDPTGMWTHVGGFGPPMISSSPFRIGSGFAEVSGSSIEEFAISMNLGNGQGQVTVGKFVVVSVGGSVVTASVTSTDFSSKGMSVGQVIGALQGPAQLAAPPGMGGGPSAMGANSPAANMSENNKSPSEIAAPAIFQNREVPEDVANNIPVKDLISFAGIRVAIAESTKQPGAVEARLRLESGESSIKIGRTIIAASMAVSLVAVLNPARTPVEIAREMPGSIISPEQALAREGVMEFQSGVREIKSIVQQPIGRPLW